MLYYYIKEKEAIASLVLLVDIKKILRVRRKLLVFLKVFNEV